MKSIGLTWTVRAVLFAALATAAAQHTVQNAEGPLKSSDELLASKGIELTGPALVSALQNRDPEVRALAALSLAQHQAYGAAPIIENALKSIRAPQQTRSERPFGKKPMPLSAQTCKTI